MMSRHRTTSPSPDADVISTSWARNERHTSSNTDNGQRRWFQGHNRDAQELHARRSGIWHHPNQSLKAHRVEVNGGI